MTPTKAASKTWFSQEAHWIWRRGGDRRAYHEYVRFRRVFTLSPGEAERAREHGPAALHITADALYQLWLNGHMVGHGPAKSAEGRRSVDTYAVATLLRAGENAIEVLVLSSGVGTMTYCPGDAGLIFELDLGKRRIASNAATQAQVDPQRRKPTVRRWMLPCLEDVDGAARPARWTAAEVVSSTAMLYARRVPLPSREALHPQRLVAAEMVQLPNFSISFRSKPYLTHGETRLRNNTYIPNAVLVTDLVSPIAQDLVLTPTMGAVTWVFRGREVIAGGSWMPWQAMGDAPPTLRLRKGKNRLVGICTRSHHEDINLCGFVRQPILAVNPAGAGMFQVVPADADLVATVQRGRGLAAAGANAWPTALPSMDPADSMREGNAHDRVVGARVRHAVPMPWGESMVLPPARGDDASRVILDLGVLHSGWVSVEATGRRGSRLIISCFEALAEGPPRRVQWPAGCNNALTVHLRDGVQRFESFLHYGARFLAVHHTGEHPVRITDLRLVTANCGSHRRGHFHCPDELLNRIYSICVQSAISATDDTFTDCPTFEQVNWNYDNRMTALCDRLSCANTAVSRNSIELLAEDPRMPGLVRSQYPSTWDSRIPLWSFHWIQYVWDHYWATGDRAFAHQLLPRVTAGIEEALSKINALGLMAWDGGEEVWHFVDWAHGRDDKHAICTAEQAALAGALQAAEKLATVAGAPQALSARWRQARRSLATATRRHLWDPVRAAYVDSLHADGTRSTVASQVSNAAMAIYGLGSPAWSRRLARALADETTALLPCGSPCGLYYIMELLDAHDQREALWRIIRRRWGDMVRAGDTTTWEVFAEFGHAGFPTRSRCHPFSSYVVKYIVKDLLGIDARAPAFARVHIRPCPPPELKSASGAIPTPHGLMRVSWTRDHGRLLLRHELPAGIRLSTSSR
ncbi:MAG: alpha-L-rhamnosidase [Lentisphaerae bacterium]|nr:alpha-L-rhamnosidase [Lentisphaerota bacterium]